ncbi:Hsp20/alpha crystallin family protein [bacterium]|nr:Hsp20/alpha crystallin family protein [bacterium]
MDTDFSNEWKNGNLVPPAVNIYDTGEEYVLKAHLPGIKKTNLDVKFTEGELIIFGKLDEETADTHEYVHREIEPGNYYRVFKISENVDADKITAKLEDGVLILKLPRYERLKPREIPIEVKG